MAQIDQGSGPRRRSAIDVARVAALGIVVLGHVTLAVIDRHDGELRGANLLALRPGWAWVAVISPMPVFFAAAGWANSTSGVERARPRLRALAGVGVVVVGCWSLAVVATIVVAGDAGIAGDGARLATQPLWFLAAYAPLSACGTWMSTMAARRSLAVFAACFGTLVVIDLVRFAVDGPSWVGWFGFLPAWGVPWLAGAWWQSWAAPVPPRHERLVGVVLAVGGGLGAAGLVHWAGYAPALIDVVPGARSNTTPPTLYTAVVGVAQVGVLLVVAPGLDRAGRRWPALWRQAGAAAVGVYAWHLTALALCAGVIAAGLPVPDRLSFTWWVSRPLWWLAVLGVTLPLVVLTARMPRRRERPDAAAPSRRRGAIGAGILTAAAAFVGRYGPTTVGRAVVGSGLFLMAWIVLRDPLDRLVAHRRPRSDA
jgi:Acyltransferase family